MKKIFLGLTILSAFSAAHVQAAPEVGARGIINFNGTITTDSCTVTSAGGKNTGVNIAVEMGEISSKSLGSQDAPGAGGSISAQGKPIDLTLECAEGATVTLKLTRQAAPKVATSKGIGVTGGATNVQIVLMNNDKVIDFATGAGSYTTAALTYNGPITLPLTAYYAREDGKLLADVKPGPANGAVAYELSYE